MLVAEIPEQTGPDVEQKLKTKSGGEFEVPGGVPRGARARGPQFTPPQRFATFALRLQPFASEFRDGAPVCSENDAFPERNGDLNFATEHTSAAKTMPGSGESGNQRFAADRCSFTGCLCNRQPVQQATGEQATSELATGESLTNSSGICRNPLDTNPFSSVVQSFRTLAGIPQESPRNP